MGKLNDLTGKRFGNVVVIERSGSLNNMATWKCKCDCGTEFVVRGNALVKGATKTCGCRMNAKTTSIDISGKRFGRLTVLKRTGSKSGHVMWECLCDCGKTTIVSTGDLTRGHTRSCGCINSGNTTHGMKHSNIYHRWLDMKSRCYNKNNKRYERYGGRGIEVCDEWKNDFMKFFEYVSKLDHYGEPGRSIDRIDNDGNYEPGNVRWATVTEQANNKGKYKLKRESHGI